MTPNEAHPHSELSLLVWDQFLEEIKDKLVVLILISHLHLSSVQCSLQISLSETHDFNLAPNSA